MAGRSRFSPRLPRSGQALLAAIALAAMAIGIGAVVDPRRAAASYLTAYVSVLTTVIGILLLVMTVELSGGSWFFGLRRSAEAVLGTLPMLGLLFIPLLLGALTLYPWLGSRGGWSDALRHTVDAKWPYLTPAFALARAAVYWVIWIGFGEAARRLSSRMDVAVDHDTARRMRVLSAAGLILVGLSSTFAAFDWLMSLSPDFVSSIFGLYTYAGATVGALALASVLLGLDLWRREHTLSTPDDLHSLGNLLLTFILFWVYLAYSQYLILWIGDIPREVGWLATHTRGSWGLLGLLVFIGHFALPFLLLLVRRVKRSSRAMIAIGTWTLLMHFLDVYWLVGPLQLGRGLAFLWLDLASIVFVAGLTIAAAIWRPRPVGALSDLRGRTLVPAQSQVRNR